MNRKNISIQLRLTRSIILGTLLVAIMLVAPASPAHAASYVVSNLNDSGAGSLRAAITAALASPEDDTITFSVNGTINLATTLPNLTSGGALTIDGTGQNITISGPGAGCSTTPVCRVFYHRITLNLINLTVTNGYSPSGGGIENSLATLNVTNCTISGNTATNSGAEGGGIMIDRGAANIVNSTISGNTGGGIRNFSSTLNVTNSTISGNTEYGLMLSGTDVVINSTIADNTNSGVKVDAFSTPTLQNTIVAHNGTNCEPSPFGDIIIDGGYNLVWGDTTCPATITNADPLLYTLEDNGGSTLTHGIAEGSAAIDQIPLASCSLVTDQRGQSRVDYNNDDGVVQCDIGAFELQTGQSPPTAITLRSLAARGNVALPALSLLSLGLLSLGAVALAFASKRRQTASARCATPTR